MRLIAFCLISAFGAMLPTTASAVGLSLNAGGSVDGDINFGTQIEVIPYLKPIPMLSAEFGYRYNVNAATQHSFVPGLNVGVPMIGRLRAGLPIGLSTDLPITAFVGLQRDILPLPFAKLYVEVDIETGITRGGTSGVVRLGGKFGL